MPVEGVFPRFAPRVFVFKLLVTVRRLYTPFTASDGGKPSGELPAS